MATIAVPVTWTAEAEAVTVLAADPQESFWVVHSSIAKPAPARETHAVNWSPHAAAAADSRSSKSSSRTLNWLEFFETEGQRPPRARANSNKVSITTTCFTTDVFWPLDAEVVLVASSAPFPAFVVVEISADEAEEEATALAALSIAPGPAATALAAAAVRC